MERLLLLTLDTLGCEAEALVNGIPVARAHAGQPHVVVPIHEYTLAGDNRLELVAWPLPAAAMQAAPPPPPLASDGHVSAHLRVLLPRAGNAVDAASARSLAQLDWAPPAGQVYQAPASLTQDVALPVSFPRWRWLDAPQVEPTPALRLQAGDLLARLARELSEGQVDGFLAATRLRTEEIATAYQLSPDDSSSRLREHLTALSADGPPAWAPVPPEGPVLRKLAGGRLLECLDASGEPAMRTATDAAGNTHIFPIRFAAVEGKLYVLR